MWQKLTVLAVAIGCATATGVAVAAPTDHARVAQQSARPRVAAPNSDTTGADTNLESKFVPIAPCRIVDTRKGGGHLAGAVARSFIAVGATGFAAQGGNSAGCGIPTAATALNVSFQAVNASGSGYLNETPFGTPFATASLLQFVSGQTIGTGATFPINASGADAFTLKASSHVVDVLVDVVGYYVAPMIATVDADGTLISGSRVLSSVQMPDLEYEVQFDRNINGCDYQVTPFSSNASVVSVGRLDNGGAEDTLLVDVDLNGELTSAVFYVGVIC